MHYKLPGESMQKRTAKPEGCSASSQVLPGGPQSTTGFVPFLLQSRFVKSRCNQPVTCSTGHNLGSRVALHWLCVGWGFFFGIFFVLGLQEGRKQGRKQQPGRIGRKEGGKEGSKEGRKYGGRAGKGRKEGGRAVRKEGTAFLFKLLETLAVTVLFAKP